MTEKEKIKFDGYDIYDETSCDLDMASLLAKEIRKSLKKKGYSMGEEQKQRYRICGGLHEGNPSLWFTRNHGADYDVFPLDFTPELRRKWENSDRSLFKEVKESVPELKKFLKSAKKCLKEEGKYQEPEKDIER